ncbi:MAG: hypothetical protein Q4G33_11540 [bacterium]|nr:hypothetical protein [bacterium]
MKKINIKNTALTSTSKIKQTLTKLSPTAKNTLQRKIKFSKMALSISIAAAILCSIIGYNVGQGMKLQQDILQVVDSKISTIEQSNNAIKEETSSFKAQAQTLSNTIAQKSAVTSAMNEYNTAKSDYNNQISNKQTSVSNLDTAITQKQAELDIKIAAKNQREQEEKAKKQYSTNYIETSEETVWVGDSGTKYHYKNCRTLRGNKHEITLKEAKAQGRTACKVCHN